MGENGKEYVLCLDPCIQLFLIPPLPFCGMFPLKLFHLCFWNIWENTMRCRGVLVFISRGFRGSREEIWLGQIRLGFMNEVVLKIVLVDHRKKWWLYSHSPAAYPASNKLVWCISKGGSRPSNTGGEPPGPHLKTSHPRTGPKFPLVSQMQTHRHRQWMNPAQKMLPVREDSRQGKKEELITHNSLTDSLIWIH